jgi:transcription antitermination factor NusG
MTWRALYCYGGRELRAAQDLKDLQIETFCPYEKFKRHTKVRGTTQVRWKDFPLFPNYIFVNCDSFLEATRVRGVLGVVSAGRRPLSIPDKIISRMRELAEPDGLARRLDMTKNSFWFKGREGDKFLFKARSPLHGLIGQITSLAKLDESGEIDAWVELFGRPTEVSLKHTDVAEIVRDDLQPVS